MAASSTELYFDVTTGCFVRSDTLPTYILLPPFYAGDTRVLRLKLVRRTAADAVEVIDLAGVTAEIGLGIPGQTPTLIVAVTSSAVDADGFLPISLALTGAAIQTALGASPFVGVVLEIRTIGAADPQRYSLDCVLKQRLLT